ncbi:hypothetical protein [Ramlibacter alkalitolerans]|uniref:Uncharacterized protein n=1 Tax=Ramlibacter alkalitolerans TaxID=2039631 RepID=A0ABS1JTP7_9BURK|nr:hypothetical protein [Ramlibacter alkalitolerans]MBL0427655.1 hypothetical protein [Ramlibacter alkalitolerans]
MSPIASLADAREDKRAQFMERAFRLCTPIDFPRQEFDHVTGAAISAEGVELLREMFTMFGVTGLDPDTGDFDTVLNTWYVLSASVFAHARSDSIYQALNAALQDTWHPEYRDYIEALKSGLQPRIDEAAARMGLTLGVPEGTPWLWEFGPVKRQT